VNETQQNGFGWEVESHCPSRDSNKKEEMIVLDAALLLSNSVPSTGKQMSDDLDLKWTAKVTRPTVRDIIQQFTFIPVVKI
jgi:hypothetical protein